MAKSIPIIYSYLYMKIKSKSRTSIIHIRYLKEIINRTLMKRNGTPRVLVQHIIRDLVKFNLLEKMDFQTYKIKESNCDRDLKQLLSYFNY